MFDSAADGDTEAATAAGAAVTTGVAVAAGVADVTSPPESVFSSMGGSLLEFITDGSTNAAQTPTSRMKRMISMGGSTHSD
jgi:hypothetical protein